jgi:hypothetical protein
MIRDSRPTGKERIIASAMPPIDSVSTLGAFHNRSRTAPAPASTSHVHRRGEM